MDRQTFDPRPLDVQAVKRAYDVAVPFRHVVIDDFFSDDDALALHRAFPVFSKLEEAKARIFAGRVYGPPPAGGVSAFASARAALASRRLARVLAEISGIESLAMDETQEGAGAHVGLRGSSLPVHADHNTHPKAPWLYRRLNLLVYVNPNWDPTWRANLLLYDRTGTQKIAEIEPRFNRAVLMEVNDRAFHGYHPLAVPPGQSRQLLASYFYSTEPSPDQTVEPHPTIAGSPSDLRIDQRVAVRLRRKALSYTKFFAPAPSWTSERNATDENIKVHS